MSQDFRNEYVGLEGFLDIGEVEMTVEFIKTEPPKTYEERFSPSEYKDVVNDLNRERVQKVNGIIQILRTFTDPTNFQKAEFKQYCRQMDELIGFEPD
jgi:hypothetical protein